MAVCKTIDRLELTRKSSRLLRNQHSSLYEPKHVHTSGGDICPRCGRHTLRHIEGCERCIECGYDACAWDEV